MKNAVRLSIHLLLHTLLCEAKHFRRRTKM